MLSLLELGDTWQPDAGILVPQLLPDLRQITNAFAKSSEHCLRAHVAWLTKSGAEQAAPAMTGRIATMDEDRISGTARNVGGKIEEGVGRLTGDARRQIQGKLDQAAGAAQDLYGQTADAARDTAATFDKWLRRTIETQPYTAAMVALGIGWLLGRMHRPL
jgi:uncharacterized protein YjbJ (UPF0337 family)